jgi:thiamine pyrophosphate-dependent acetolactate synthase large subunit-like protein
MTTKKFGGSSGGEQIAGVLQAHGVRFLFTLCGGHISPILKGAKDVGIRVVDVRHEATAVFAADAVARLTGTPGVAAVTAGPGATNTITAVKNAQLAQSPVVLLGGAAATMLKGRGALQDIDQLALMRPHVKWAHTCRRVRDLAPTLRRALHIARSGVPGPVFIECPVDLLYPQSLVADWYAASTPRGSGVSQRIVRAWMTHHLNGLFAGAGREPAVGPVEAPIPRAPTRTLGRAAKLVEGSRRPVMVIGSQALVDASHADALASAVERIGIPVYLSGMARGLLGPHHPLHMRHRRRKALREADLVILAGVPCDFRLDYGRSIGPDAALVSANRSRQDLTRNRRPDLACHGDAGAFVRALAEQVQAARNGSGRAAWLTTLRARDDERDAEIASGADVVGEFINPVRLCRDIDARLPDDSVLIADGGDFVATASYILHPRRRLAWLDPGAFGTLGCGAGFALGASLCRPGSEVWALFGDGSVGYALAEFDTFVRHRVPVLAVVGNDACWSQIAREQVKVLDDDVGTVLARTDYHRVAEAFGGSGLLLRDAADTPERLAAARRAVAAGTPVLLNAWLDRSDFREGSISM